jgi:hypothetical protein
MSTDLVKRDEAQSIMLREVKKLQDQLIGWRGKAHILTPMARTTIDMVAPGFIPSLRATQLDPNPRGNDVYPSPQGKGKLALRKGGLVKLDHLAGIKWLHSTRVDDRSDPRKAEYNCSAAVQDIDGTWRTECVSGSIDLNDGAPQAEALAKGDNGPKALANARVHIAALAESKAQNRLRRVILGLQDAFTEDEIKLPFVVLKMVPDPSDPIMRQLIMRQGIGAETMLFPQSETPKALNVATMEGASGLELSEPPGTTITDPTTVAATPVTANPLPQDPLPPSDPKQAIIDRITALYRIKIATGVRDPKKPLLKDLSDEQLAAMEAHMKSLPDYRPPDI